MALSALNLAAGFQLELHSQRLLDCRGLELLLLLYLGVKRKWWRSAADPLLGFGALDSSATDDTEPLPGEHVEPPVPDQEQAEHEEAQADDVPQGLQKQAGSQISHGSP